MIVIHEFGHFIVAKMLGIAVETFSVGFGPRLLGIQAGRDRLSFECRARWEATSSFAVKTSRCCRVRAEGTIEEFLTHPKWKRFLVAVAGAGLQYRDSDTDSGGRAYLVGFRDSADQVQKPVIGRVSAELAAAARPGFVREIEFWLTTVAQNPTWRDIELGVMLRPNQEIPRSRSTVTGSRSTSYLKPTGRRQYR
jgi:regulator of sigma E protease